MKGIEIAEELELCIRSFLEAQERSEHEGMDDFDELRILEASFNRLFISIEHLCNAIILAETGNFSKKHFGDFAKLSGLKEKYQADLAGIYQTTYNFRSYADYRKCQEIRDKFKRAELKIQVKIAKAAIKTCLDIMAKQLNVGNLAKRL